VNKPLVLIGGTSQVIGSFLSHVGPFSKERLLLQYEARGQGTLTSLRDHDATSCSLPQQANDLRHLLHSLQLETPLDLCGFSFGGRVALAFAAEYPTLVNRVVVTGVPAQRTALGATIFKAWRASLKAGDLEAFLWHSLVDGHSESFITKHETKLSSWIESACKINRIDAIRALVEQSHHEDPADPFHTTNLAKRVASVLGPQRVLVIGGSEDRIADQSEVKRLATIGGWQCQIVEGAGHSVPMEQPALWGGEVLSFLDR